MLELKKEFFEQIVKHCIMEFPNEACGILAGREGIVKKAYPMVNTDKSPQSFLMDPKEQLKVNKEMRALGLEMLGIYHSHVASAAYPSGHDVEMAFYPDVFYVIFSLQDKDNPLARAFKIQDSRITEEELRIAP